MKSTKYPFSNMLGQLLITVAAILGVILQLDTPMDIIIEFLCLSAGYWIAILMFDINNKLGK